MPNNCSCPKPPGGNVICQADQIAYCKVVGGELESGCLQRPPRNQYGRALSPEEAFFSVLSRIGFDVAAPVSISVELQSSAEIGSRAASYFLARMLDSGTEVAAFGRTVEVGPVVGGIPIEARIRFPRKAGSADRDA